MELNHLYIVETLLVLPEDMLLFMVLAELLHI